MPITRSSFRGEERREDVHKGVAEADELSPHDRISTIAHLTDTVASNGRHAFVHVKEAAKQAKKLKGSQATTVQHNIAHGQKHLDEVVDHAKKLGDALARYPGVAAMEKELNQAIPSRKPGPPK
jgi:hypothetical protein